MSAGPGNHPGAGGVEAVSIHRVERHLGPGAQHLVADLRLPDHDPEEAAPARRRRLAFLDP